MTIVPLRAVAGRRSEGADHRPAMPKVSGVARGSGGSRALPPPLRLGAIGDVGGLVALEQRCFESDRITRRSWLRLLRSGSAVILVADGAEHRLHGALILLFHRNRSIARLYSLAVDPEARHRGLARLLLRQALAWAEARDCDLLRLEVRADNAPAQRLYLSEGFSPGERVAGYYQDGADALRFERSLWQAPADPRSNAAALSVPYYGQTLNFTCGPSALMMAMSALDPGIIPDRRLEIRLWREATTVFMAAGHGGCGPFGLALAAHRRGFDVTIHKPPGPMFLDSVRDQAKKEVIALVEEDMRAELAATSVRLDAKRISVEISPSRRVTLDHLAEIGLSLGVETTILGIRDRDRLAGFDGLFIRQTTSVENGTFGFAMDAERQGMPVIDDPGSILRCGNKVYLAGLLPERGIATPETRLVTRADVEAIARQGQFPLVLKAPDGCFGAGVKRAEDPEQFRAICAGMLDNSAVILAQRFMPTSFDWRIGLLGGTPLFAARYHMCGGHWQIIRHNEDGSHAEGRTEAVALAQVPEAVLDAACRAGGLIGQGLYGIDLKQTPAGVFVIEINDNPNIDLGLEDAAEGDAVYYRLLRHFQRAGRGVMATAA